MQHTGVSQAAQSPVLPSVHHIQRFPILGKKGKLSGVIGSQDHSQQIKQGTFAASAETHQGNLLSPMNHKLGDGQGKTLLPGPAFGYCSKAKEFICSSVQLGCPDTGLVPSGSTPPHYRHSVSGSVLQRSSLLHVQRSSPLTLARRLHVRPIDFFG
jgi:hypothetical protein